MISLVLPTEVVDAMDAHLRPARNGVKASAGTFPLERDEFIAQLLRERFGIPEPELKIRGRRARGKGATGG